MNRKSLANRRAALELQAATLLWADDCKVWFWVSWDAFTGWLGRDGDYERQTSLMVVSLVGKGLALFVRAKPGNLKFGVSALDLESIKTIGLIWNRVNLNRIGGWENIRAILEGKNIPIYGPQFFLLEHLEQTKGIKGKVVPLEMDRFGTFQAHHSKPDSVSWLLNPVLMFLSSGG